MPRVRKALVLHLFHLFYSTLDVRSAFQLTYSVRRTQHQLFKKRIISHVHLDRLKPTLVLVGPTVPHLSAGLMPTEAVAIICPSPLTYARQRHITANHSSRYDILAIISSRYQYGPFLFFVAEVMSNHLTTDGLKNFLYHRRPPEA